MKSQVLSRVIQRRRSDIAYSRPELRALNQVDAKACGIGPRV